MALGDLLVRVGAEFDASMKQLEGLSSQIEANAQKAANAFAGFDRIGDSLTGLGTGLTAAITVPLAGIGYAAATAAGDFEGAMNKIKANLDGVTAEGMGQLDALAKKLGADTKFSALEAAQGMGEFAAAGYNVNQIAAAIGPTLDLAAAAQTNVAEAATITKDILGQFGLSAEQAGGAIDMLAKAGTLSSGSLQEVANSLSYVGPVARSAGLDLAQTSAALVELDASGIRGEKAGTALRAMLTSLASPSTEASKVIAKLGIDIKDAAGNMLPFPQIMDNFKAGLEKTHGSADRLAAITAVFGREALAAAQVLTSQGGPALVQFEQQLRNSEGAAKAIAQTMNSGMNGALEQLKGSLESAGIAFGQVLIPFIVDTAKQLQHFVDTVLVPAINWFKELPQPVQNAALAMAAMAAAAGPLLLVAGQLFSSVSSIAAGFATYSSAAGGASTATTLLSGAMNIFATGLIAAGVAIAGFEISGIISDFKNLTDTLGLTGEKATQTAQAVKTTGDAAAQTKPPVDGLTQAWKDYKAALPSVDILSGPLGIIRQTLKDTTAAVQILSGKWKDMDTAIASSAGALGRVQAANMAAAKAAGDHGLALAQQEMAQRKATEEQRKAAEAAKAHAAAAEISEKQQRAAARSAQELESALRALGASADGGTPKLAAMHDKLVLIDQAYKDGKVSAEQLVTAYNSYTTALEQANPETVKFEAALRAAGVQLPGAATSLSTLNGHLAAAEKAFKAGGDNAQAAAAAIEILKQKIEAANNPLMAMSSEFDKLATAMGKAHPTLTELTATSQTTIRVLGELAGKTAELTAEQFKSQEATLQAQAAAKALGITLEQDTRKGVDAALKAYQDLKATGVATPRDLQFAWDAYIIKKIEAARKAGEEISREDSQFYTDAKKRLEDHQKGTTDSWSLMSKQVSTIMTDLSKDIGNKFTDMLMSGKFTVDGIVDLFSAAGKAIVRMMVETAFKDIMKGLQDMDLSFANFGKSITNLFSSIAKTIGGFFGAGSNVAGSIPTPGTPGGTGGSSVPLGSPTNVFGMITGAVDAITGVLGYLQGRRMEQDIGRIEVTSREIKAETENRRKDAWEQHNQMYGRLGEVWQSMMDKFDALIQAVQEGGGSKQIIDAIEDTGGQAERDAREQREVTGRGGRSVVTAVEAGTTETTEGLKNVTRNVDGLKAPTERTADATEETAENVIEAASTTATRINEAQLQQARTMMAAINNPAYAEGLRKIQMDVFGEVYNWNKNYSPEALTRYAEMVKALQDQLGISETTKGALIEIGFASGRMAQSIEATAPSVQATAGTSSRTAQATEATASNVVQLGVGLGNLIGGIGANIVPGINHISATIITTSTASTSAMIDPLARTATATAATVSAVQQNTQTLATGLGALGTVVSGAIRDIPSAPVQIPPFSQPVATTPFNYTGGGDRPTTPAATTPTTPATSTAPRTGGEGPSRPASTPTTPNVVTTADTARILDGSTIFAQYAQPTSWSPFNYQNPSGNEQAQAAQQAQSAADLAANAYLLSVMDLQSLANSIAEQSRLQAEQAQIDAQATADFQANMLAGLLTIGDISSLQTWLNMVTPNADNLEQVTQVRALLEDLLAAQAANEPMSAADYAAFLRDSLAHDAAMFAPLISAVTNGTMTLGDAIMVSAPSTTATTGNTSTDRPWSTALNGNTEVLEQIREGLDRWGTSSGEYFERLINEVTLGNDQASDRAASQRPTFEVNIGTINGSLTAEARQQLIDDLRDAFEQAVG